MNRIKRIVSQFESKNGFCSPTSIELMSSISNLGYCVVEFNSSYNDDNVTNLISALGLFREISQYKAFTYHDNKYRFVFISNHLSENEKCILLSHELGHILCNHFGKNVIMGQNIENEWEANEFSHYLLNPGAGRKICFWARKHTYKILIFLCAALVAGGSLYMLFSSLTPGTESYYVTQNGTKYHKKNCIYIKNKDNIRKLSEEDIKSKKYAPCKICLPE